MIRPHSSTALRSLVCCVFALSATSACNRVGGDEAIKTQTIYDMLVAFPRAQILNEKPGSTSRAGFDVGGDARQGLFVHPPSGVVFAPIHLSGASVLQFKIGIITTAWEEMGDGVDFGVFVESATEPKQKIFSQYIDPKNKLEDRRWFELHLPLSAFANQDVTITLATEPGPEKEFTADWAVFAEPQVVLSSKP